MGNRFKDLREDYNDNRKTSDIKMRQEDLAKELGVDKTVISRLENGQYPITMEILKFYHTKFKVSYEYLMGECTAKQPENVNISKELGLTDEAIKNLNKLANSKADLKNMSLILLNVILEDEYLTFSILNSMLNYLNNCYAFEYAVDRQLLTIELINKEFERMLPYKLAYLHKNLLPKMKKDIEEYKEMEMEFKNSDEYIDFISKEE